MNMFTGYGNQYLETNKPDQSLLTDTQTLLRRYAT